MEVASWQTEIGGGAKALVRILRAGMIALALLSDSPRTFLRLDTEGAVSALAPRPRPPAPAIGTVSPQSERESENERCLARIATAKRSVLAPGAPRVDAARIALLTQTKAQPQLFIEPPQYSKTPDAGISSYRRWLERTRHPASVLRQLYVVLKGKPAALRDVLLRDGYLYAEDLALARTLVDTVRAELLFDEAAFWIQRGEALLRAVRGRSGYVYAEGPEEGKRVALLLFDRVGVGEPTQAVHRDVHSLRYRLSFDRLEVMFLGWDQLVVKLHYGPHAVLALLRAQGPRLDLDCEVIPSDQQESIERWREERITRTRAFRRVQSTILLQVADALPFDEPRQEAGQEDGKLRKRWRLAYDTGQSSYFFREDEYPVFSPVTASL